MPTVNPALPNNGDDAVVDPYNAAFQAILAVINGSIDEDNLAAGGVILSKLSSAVQAALTPAGTILAYGGSAAPTGFLLCYGQAISRSTYSDLFAVISTSFGIGNGTSTFNLPDLRGRIPVGADAIGNTAANISQTSTTLTTTSGSPTGTVGSATGLSIGDKIVSTNVTAGTTITAISGTTITMSANATGNGTNIAARFSQMANDAQVIGAIGGVRAHTLVTAQLAAHTHTQSVTNGTPGAGPYIAWNVGIAAWSAATANAGYDTQSAGGGQPHPNMPPSQVVNYMIKV